MEHRLERLFHRDIQEQNKTLARIEKEVLRTNGRVTGLEQKAVRAEIAAETRAEVAQETAKIVAEKVESKERSRKWWAGVIAATAAGIGTIATVASLLANYIH
jgi:hypothetical protein